MALGQLLREICHEPGSLRNRLLNDLSCAMGGTLNRFALGLLAAALLAADATDPRTDAGPSVAGGVAAWAVVAWLAANSDVDFRAAP